MFAGTPRTLVAKVERVVDGDTLIAITTEGTKLRIRLLPLNICCELAEATACKCSNRGIDRAFLPHRSGTIRRRGATRTLPRRDSA